MKEGVHFVDIDVWRWAKSAALFLHHVALYRAREMMIMERERERERENRRNDDHVALYKDRKMMITLPIRVRNE
jgi:hypothetical protein